MRKVKLLLSAFVITIAFSAALASRMVTTDDGYKMVNDGTPVSVDCSLVGVCDNTGEFRCTANDGSSVIDLFKLNSSNTACDQPILHTSPDPINP
jgi:hypothetical protein